MIGLWILTRDDFSDFRADAPEMRIGDAVVQTICLEPMIFDVPPLIAFCSIWTQLPLGDEIATGTPVGASAFRQSPIWPKAGNTVAVTAKGLGSSGNSVIAER
ncbi:fumarylacetoacetate hydrolase family protein [Novosphingobium pentaromativorans]|uniref:Fumarylacetoacetase-like C-terminal domain-containing protein n=1 Tax=Novosphingobium pentaromativorans US6-1 TaxID=1088721 RepID=G6EH32_9SPHN|nr:fumarylacetoacetate hydrolase family protein [Novosphingobium pentaromativorans]EHJ59321.1 hypothetical protein NSU_3653 [Novosphingobium pentaromativorans US6-1]